VWEQIRSFWGSIKQDIAESPLTLTIAAVGMTATLISLVPPKVPDKLFNFIQLRVAIDKNNNGRIESDEILPTSSQILYIKNSQEWSNAAGINTYKKEKQIDNKVVLYTLNVVLCGVEETHHLDNESLDKSDEKNPLFIDILLDTLSKPAIICNELIASK